MLHPGMRTSSIFNTQHMPTGLPNARNMFRPTMLQYDGLKYCDRLAGACKSSANNVGICYVDMLRSLGQDLRTFARKFSNTDFFLRILPLKDDELVMSEM